MWGWMHKLTFVDLKLAIMIDNNRVVTWGFKLYQMSGLTSEVTWNTVNWWSVSWFSLISTLFVLLSPKCPHSFAQPMTCFSLFHFPTQSLSYLILSYLFILFYLIFLLGHFEWQGQPGLFGILRDSVAGVCADLLLSYQRNSVGVDGNGGDEGGSRGFWREEGWMGGSIVGGDWSKIVVVELIEVHKQFSQITVQIPVDLL